VVRSEAAAEVAGTQPAAIDDREQHEAVVQNGSDRLQICRVVNGMWQTSGGWGKIERDQAVDAMLRHVDAGFTTFDMADHYGPAEDLYGIFINKIRKQRGDEAASNVRGLTKWVPPPVKMTRAYVESNIDRSRKRMDVKALDMLQFHWYLFTYNLQSSSCFDGCR
jgi:aryl-alcohol dehydrogenase-like predicted oxidoreductase